MNICLTPSVTSVGMMSSSVPQSLIIDEPMLYNASPDFAEEADGVLTSECLKVLRKGGHLTDAYRLAEKIGWHLIIDTRVHMLMEGMYPAIPGWHCDNWDRRGDTGQPDIFSPGGRAARSLPHWLVHVSDVTGGVSRTLFADLPLVFEPDLDAVWKSAHEAYSVKERRWPLRSARQFADGEIVRMTQETLHRAEAAITRGWRWWFRLSIMRNPPKNRHRKQVQVYTTEGGGW